MDIPSVVENAQQPIALLNGGANLAQNIRKLVQAAKGSAASTAQITELTLELQQKLIDAQQAQSALLNDLLDLKSEMMQMDRRLELETRYQLHETPAGAQVLVLRPERHDGEPLHYICPTCADAAKKSILQPQGTGKRCPACDTFFPFEPDGGGSGYSTTKFIGR